MKLEVKLKKRLGERLEQLSEMLWRFQGTKLQVACLTL